MNGTNLVINQINRPESIICSTSQTRSQIRLDADSRPSMHPPISSSRKIKRARLTPFPSLALRVIQFKTKVKCVTVVKPRSLNFKREEIFETRFPPKLIRDDRSERNRQVF